MKPGKPEDDTKPAKPEDDTKEAGQAQGRHETGHVRRRRVKRARGYSRMRASVAAVECPGSISASATLPPQPRTRSAPTTCSSV
jgi:hypothetical protein